MENSNKQRYGREISDLRCPQHTEWLRNNPEPKVERKIIFKNSMRGASLCASKRG